MAEPIGALRAEMSANHAQFVSDMGKAKRAVRDAGQSMSQDMDKARRSFNDSTGALVSFRLKALALTAATAMLAKSAVQTADQYTLLDNKLKLVTGSAADLATVQKGLYDQALRSHSSYSASVDLYARFARSTQSLGTSQKDLLRIVETVNKAFIISGATQQEAANAIVQLSQGMAAGALRGEEFNSIMEQGSRVAQMLAEYLDTDVGGLRKLAQEGKITSEIIVNAFSASARTIDDEFGKMQTTIAQAMTDLRTVFGKLVSDSDKAAGSTNQIAQEISNIAKTIDANREGIIDLFATMLSLANRVVKALANIGQSFRGWSAVKSGQLDFLDFAGMNAEDLDAWLKANDTEAKRIQSSIDKKREELAAAQAKQSRAILPMYRSVYDNDIARLKDEIRLLESAKADVLARTQTVNESVLAGAPPPPPPPGGTGKATGTTAKAPKVDYSDVTDNWRLQHEDRYEIQSRSIDAMIEEEERLKAESIKAAEGVTDFWQLQHEERYAVQSRAIDAMIQAEEESGLMMAEFSQRTAEAMEQNFADLFFDVMKGNLRDLEDFTDAVLNSMARAASDYMGQLMRIGLFGEKGGDGGLIQSIGSWLLSKHGNAFMGGRLIPYAKGGIVDRPTIFPMAAGAGLMGEAGPEAVLPLKRGRGGDLGVQAAVAAPEVNITVHNMVQGAQARVEDHGGMNFEVIVEQVENSIAGRAQRGTGIGPWLDGRYRKAT